MGLADVYINAMIGLGLGNMFSRTITLGGLGFALQYFIKPSISYTKVSTKSGEKSIAKEFALTSKASPPMTTYFPWYLWPATFMALSVLLL